MAIPDDPFGKAGPSGSSPETRRTTTSNPTSPILAPALRNGAPSLTALRLDTGTPSGTASAGPSAAGPSGATGAKTPRRVQWTNESHIVSIAPDGNNELSPVNTLDETNFERVKDALERHRNTQPGEEDITAQDDEEDYDYRLDVGSGGEDRHRRHLHRTGSNFSSNGSSVNGDEHSDDEDHHDHSMAAMSEAIRRGSLRMGLTNPQFMEDDAAAIRPDTNVDPSAFGTANANIQGMLPDVAAPSEQDQLHAQMAVFVDPGETDGMPSLPPPTLPTHRGSVSAAGMEGAALAENQAQASALVRAHKTGRFGFLRNRKAGLGLRSGFGFGGADSSKKPGDAEQGNAALDEKRLNEFAARYPEEGGEKKRRAHGAHTPLGMISGVGHTAGKLGSSAFQGVGRVGGAALHGAGKVGGTMSAGALAGGSVLASLLALHAPDSQPPSGTTTPASSRPPSFMLSDDDSSEEERREKERWKREKKDKERRRQEQKEMDRKLSAAAKAQGIKTPRGGWSTLSRATSHVSTDGPNTPTEPAMDASPNAPLSSKNRSRSQNSLPDLDRRSASPAFMKGLKSVADKMGLDLDEYERPKAARSGGGVFGALVQSTGHLSSVATPAASTLVPAAKRPGYKLSRYSLDGANRKPEDGNTTPQSRPASLYAKSVQEGDEGSEAGSPSSGNTKVDAVPAATPGPTVAGPRRAAPPSSIELPPGYKSTDKANNRHSKAFSLKDFKMGPLTPGGTNPKKPGTHWMLGGKSQPNTPPTEYNEKGGEYFLDRQASKLTEDDWRRREWEREKKKRKKAKEKKKQQEIFIIQHVAAILARQQFILKLTRAFMMFGSPSHRLEAQIQATARVLELNCQVVYFPGTCLISFNDDATHTSESKFLKQSTGLDLGKLLKTHYLYWNVVHDKISAEEASTELDGLMLSKAHYNNWAMLCIGGMCSAFICCIAFYGSFIDALISIPLGVLLIAVQILAARNDLYSNIFEIIIATLNSFLAAALASTNHFCFTAVASSAIVLILPGYIVLTGALELASRNITAGATRIAYSVIYSLFLGFGISMGVTIYERITGLQVVGSSDYTCASTHYSGAPWYQSTPNEYWYFLIAPGYSFFLSLRQSQPIFAKETPAMVLFSCAGWVTNHFVGIAFPNRSDISSMVGSLVVGVLGNLWGRFFQGTSFIVMLVGILFQLPSGLSQGGLFAFANSSVSGEADSYASGFDVAEQLVSCAIGLTVGLFLAAVVVHPFGGGKKRGSAIFSF